MNRTSIFILFTISLIVCVSWYILELDNNSVQAQVNQGTDCLCSANTYYNGSVCVQGTLSCVNTISDPVCGCNGSSYLNSCIAQANGVKTFTKGDCNTTVNFVCSTDDQCPLGTCPNDKTYQKFKCTATMCALISFSADPCPLVPSSSTSSGSEDCKCASGQFFDGKQCITGTLSCLNTVNDPVCSCDNFTFLNSCIAMANGIKKFSKGDCGTSNISCKKDDDCPAGQCSNGTTFKRFTCNQAGKCASVIFSSEPCASSSSSGAQGDECRCLAGSYFDGALCVPGTLECLNPVSDPVCGCDSITYLNSCIAKASGVKTFTSGKCNVVAALNCKSDSDCPSGICPDGKLYKRFSCTASNCTQLVSSTNPCGITSSSSSSSSSGGAVIELNKNFTGIWTVESSRCGKLTFASSSSSGSCISCPNLMITCQAGSILTPQTCSACPTCAKCFDAVTTFAFCAQNNTINGIVNHSEYLDRGIIESTQTSSTNNKNLAKLTISNKKLISPNEGLQEEPVTLTLKLTSKNMLTGIFDNMLYLESVKARKLSKSGCLSTNFPNDCCNGFILSTQESICPAGFAKSLCVLAGKAAIPVCCPTSSCQNPCGSMCCKQTENCLSLDPCLNSETPFCYAPVSLICQDCSSRGSCINNSPCPGGTTCTGEPDFFCKALGCFVSTTP